MLRSVVLFTVLFACVNMAYPQLSRANQYFDNLEYVKAIPLYKKVVKKDSTNVVALQRLASCYRLLKNYTDAELIYSKVVQQANVEPINYFFYGIVLRNNNKPLEAKEQFVKYARLAPADKTTEVSIKSCEDLKIWLTRPPRFEIKNLTDINTSAAEFCPIIYRGRLLFTAERTKDLVNFEMNSTNNQPYLDLFFTIPSEEKGVTTFSKLKKMQSPINSDYHDGPISIDKNNTVYITRVYNYSRGKNFINRPQLLIAPAKKSNQAVKDWETPDPFPFNSNDYAIQHPSINADADVLYFSSDMPGGQGGSDIWRSRKKGDKWQAPENLGPAINTAGNEVFPYIRKDGMLYFSSDGHPGFGGLDIYSATNKDDKWIDIVNLGLPLNSSTDDFGIFFNDDNETGYYSSDRAGGKGVDDLYSFKTSNKAIDISGKVLLSDNINDAAGNVKVFLMTDDGAVVNFTTSDSLGFFNFENLSPDVKYLVKVDEDDPVLRIKNKLFMADKDNKIVRVTVINKKGDKFVFSNLPVIQGALPQLDEGRMGLPTLMGRILYGETPQLPLVNAKVNLLNEKGELIKTIITNSIGKFAFTELSPDLKYLMALDEGSINLLPAGIKVSVYNDKGEEIASTTTGMFGFKFELLQADQAKLTLSKEEDQTLRMNMRGKLLSGVGANNPLAKVVVQLVDDKGQVLQTDTTNEYGQFIFTQLPSDISYLVRVEEGNPTLAKLSKILIADETGKVIGEMNNEKKNGFRFEYLAFDEKNLSLMTVDDMYLKFKLKGKIIAGDGSNTPISGLRINLLSDKNGIIQTTYTDSTGKFIFKKLAPMIDFPLSVDEKNPKLAKLKSLLITDERGNLIREIKMNSKGKFNFELLSADIKTLTMLEVEDAKLKTDLFGKLGSMDGSRMNLAGKKINLVNEKGEIIESTTTDENGKFEFRSLPADQKYLVKLDESELKLAAKLKLILNDEKGKQIKELQSNSSGEFNYELLAAELATLKLEMEQINKIKINLKGRFMLGDSANKPLANSKVNLMDNNGKIVQVTTTDKFGRFLFSNLPSDQTFMVGLDENDPLLKNISRLVISDGKGVTVKDLRNPSKTNFRFNLLPADIKALTDEEVSTDFSVLNKIKLKLNFKTNNNADIKTVINTPSDGSYPNFENIYFETGESELLPESKVVLRSIADYLKKTPGTVIDILSHADSRASEQANLFLSDNRAREARKYLAGLGINITRIKAVGLGERFPVNNCSDANPCTEEQYKQNRRTEFKIRKTLKKFMKDI